jgi:hypothetical protein
LRCRTWICSPDMLARSMLGYFGDRAVDRRHAKAAQRVVASRFSLMRMVSDYSLMYEGALDTVGVALPSNGDAAHGEPVAPGQTRTVPY